MIKFQVDNMSCGSCRVKVKAKLEDNGFENINIDVNNNYVTMEGTTTKKEVIDILASIKYVVDENTYEDHKIYTYWDDILLKEESMNLFNQFLEENNIDIIDFDDEEITFKLQAKESNFNQLKEYISSLK